MRITLITVCYKSREKIKAYVNSFLEYHKDPSNNLQYQFIFVENSGDYSFQDAVQPLVNAGFKVIVLNTNNQGFGRGCNEGARFATTELLIFANPDIHFICNLGDLLDESLRITWGTVRQLSRSGRVTSFDFYPEYKGMLYEIFRFNRFINLYPTFFRKYCYVVGSFLIVSKKLFELSGGFNPAFFLYHEEAELARRLRVLSGSPNFYKAITIIHESFGSQSSYGEVLKHEARGFLTYCHITHQPALINRRLTNLHFLGLFSEICMRRYKVLKEAIFWKNPELT